MFFKSKLEYSYFSADSRLKYFYDNLDRREISGLTAYI